MKIILLIMAALLLLPQTALAVGGDPPGPPRRAPVPLIPQIERDIATLEAHSACMNRFNAFPPQTMFTQCTFAIGEYVGKRRNGGRVDLRETVSGKLYQSLDCKAPCLLPVPGFGGGFGGRWLGERRKFVRVDSQRRRRTFYGPWRCTGPGINGPHLYGVRCFLTGR